MMDIKIKTASAADAEAFIKLIRDSSLKEDFQFSEPLPTLKAVTKMLTNPLRHVYIAEDKNNPAGFISLYYMSQPERKHMVTIQAIQVVPDQRKKGVGYALLKHALEKISEDGRNLVILDVIAINQAAIELYKKFGFKIYGELPSSFVREGRNFSTVSLFLEIKPN